ncbi:MAG: Gamma-glutamyltranspeptidase precursor [Pseudomonadota bacterium]|jgi:gamma-glutamyltranspeptidase/glutathione hydrolase
MRTRTRSSTLATLLLLPWLLLAAAPPPERARKGMVAADHRLASAAGAELIAQGGNAVDGVVAAALAAGVVQPSASGLGGGGFAVLVGADGQPRALDFREVAPAAAHRDMFVQSADPKASVAGGLAVAVPMEAQGLALLHRRHGALPWAKVVAPAQRLAAGGFEPGAHLLKSLGGAEGERLAAGLFGPGVKPTAGARVRRARLAAALSSLARTGGESFRTGEVAADMVDAARAAGGVLTMADLAAAAPKDRAPLAGSYRGWTVITMPPPSSGGVVLLQALAALEAYDLRGLGHNSAEYLHLIAEVMKHGFADRARHMGDPDRVTVDVAGLLAPARVEAIRRAVLPSRTFPPDRYGAAVDPGRDAGTQHISAMDAAGLTVALTTTVNTSFGSGVISPKFGVVLNNEMDDFVARPGVPNAFGLVGSAANAVAPGARPLSSMSPTVLIGPEGQRIAVGASGGPFIISSTLQAILNVIDFQMSPSRAVAEPRIHHQWQPDVLMLDEGISADTAALLRARGHATKELAFFSAVQLIATDGPELIGGADPRKGGWPAGAW